MKQKNDSAVDRAVRITQVFLGASVLCGLLLLIVVQSRASENQQLQVFEFVVFVLVIGVFAAILGAGILRLINDDTRPSQSKQDEILKDNTNQVPPYPRYQLTDDGEIMEVVDDEKPKREADSTGE